MVIWSVLSRFCFELEAKDIDTGAVWSQCEVGQGGLRKACRNSLQFEVLSDFTFFTFSAFTLDSCNLESFQSLLPFRLCPKSTMSLQ